MKASRTALSLSLLASALLACGGDEGTGSGDPSGGPGSGGSGHGSGGGNGGSGNGEGGLHPGAPPSSPYMIVDQFGYLPGSAKVALARDPVTGFDADEAFTPATTFELVRAGDGKVVTKGPVVPWNGGAEDPSSGDHVWRFDFSSVKDEGSYYVRDPKNDVRSPVFRIHDDVYRGVLRAAVRTFFYQRAGQEKSAEHAGAAWADGASHLGALQDGECRRYDAPGDAGTERDLRGGWYDAGDYNKYTNWTARYVITLLRAYTESPSAFDDDTNIPESGNGVPDVLDEAKYGMDWLVRMQSSNGSVLSIVGVDHASPPSAAKGQSLYGNANTSASLSTAAAFALGAKVFGKVPSLASYASDLADRAKDAFAWAQANPNVIFENNVKEAGTEGLGSGQQETDDYGRLTRRVEAAVYLFDATGDTSYRGVVDDLYDGVHLVNWTSAYPYETDEQEMLLHYAMLPNATPSVASAIRNAYSTSMNGADENFPAIDGDRDAYLAFLPSYTWGSNRTKAVQGSMFWDMLSFEVPGADAAKAKAAAEGYVHYVHGVNPFGMVYLSNMRSLGAEKSVNEFYHSWFADGSKLWDRVGESKHGPAPGFLPGGPNPSYGVDGCCPSGCGESSALCTSENLTPPEGQPDQKSYKDFNTSWPVNSWAVTENSNGYQVAYIRLLAKLVK